MKIAVPFEDGQVFQHFGRSAQFKFYEAENGQLLRTEVIPTNGQGHGALAGFLVQHGADVVLCGGIGTGAQVALMQAGIQLFGGLSGAADAAVADYLAGKLVFDPDIHCTHHDHDEGRSCGSHCGGQVPLIFPILHQHLLRCLSSLWHRPFGRLKAPLGLSLLRYAA